MTRIRIYPYKMGSKSARLLSESLGALRTRSVGSYTPRSEDFIIGWGNSIIPAFFERVGHLNAKFINPPDKVRNASNKLRTFRILQEHGISIPEFTNDIQVARNWSGEIVYGRAKLTGHSGEGIDIFRPELFEIDIPDYPLYTKAIENHGEYRVHVVDGQVIAYTKKKRHRGSVATDEQLQIRNLDNGWIYSSDDLRRLDRIEELAISAVSALGLDFGAVDIIKDENGDVYVLEVNTSPGLSPSTLGAYVVAFRNLIENTYA